MCSSKLNDRYNLHSHTDRQADTHRHRAYKDVQVPPSNLAVNVGNDNYTQNWQDIVFVTTIWRQELLMPPNLF